MFVEEPFIREDDAPSHLCMVMLGQWGGTSYIEGDERVNLCPSHGKRDLKSCLRSVHPTLLTRFNFVLWDRVRLMFFHGLSFLSITRRHIVGDDVKGSVRHKVAFE